MNHSKLVAPSIKVAKSTPAATGTFVNEKPATWTNVKFVTCAIIKLFLSIDIVRVLKTH